MLYRRSLLRLRSSVRLRPWVVHSRAITLGMPTYPQTDSQDDTRDSAHTPTQTTRDRILESAVTTLASLILLGLSGFAYHKYYKWLTLYKIEKSFEAGDPALQFHHNTQHNADSPIATAEDAKHHQFAVRDEQSLIDAIVHGERAGSYFLIIGEKGNGKRGMLLNAMHKNQGLNTSIMEVHSDLEVFRIRLGKTLDYEFTEDFVGSLFSIKGQRDAGPILDIERAFNKLEKIAIRHQRKDRRPLVLIFNNMHLIQDDKDGNALLELLQQRAESFASTGLMTFIFNSDEYWILERLKGNNRRMELIPVSDLPKAQAIEALRRYRTKLFGSAPSEQQLERVWQAVGGRLSFLSKIAKAPDMLARADSILQQEKTWVLSQCALIPDFDDDVLDDGKWQGGSFTLAKALVDEEKANPEKWKEELASIPLHRCRQLLTRADFMQRLDALNIISVNTDASVRADSRAMMNAFRDICGKEDFEAQLENVLDRCSAVESLQRTREIIFKAIENSDGTPNETGQGGIVKIHYEKLADKTESDVTDEDDPFADASARED